MKRKRERKNRERVRVKRMVLLHFAKGKIEFLLQFWRKKKAENFELEILEVLLPLKGSKVLPICAEKLKLFVANLCRKFRAVCAEKLELFAAKNWSCLCRKIGVVCCRKIRAVYAEKLELFAANLCKKIGQHCAANLREKKQLGATKFLRKRELKVLPPEEEENDPRKRGSHGGEERKTWW
ncbi:Uncharacterized protein TCM_043574 [Theobroma cacao]|uniref:Uncharacterized protein n=1 Tax=Theobroma cacao TaxID=3641 RepID=A0A061FQ08_THECC|nr:Uncharacterized protein TCM_043574 [Theobroma cacao]